MKINNIQSIPPIGSKAPLKASRVKNTSFKEVLDSTITKTNESNLDNIFQAAAEKYGISNQLLKAVAKVESNFNPNAVSSAGASGIMQLMPGTAKGLGVTDVFDAQENINGGAKYLSQLYKRYDGDLRLTLAAYNAGPGNVDKYGGVPPFKETQNYIKKVEKVLRG